MSQSDKELLAKYLEPIVNSFVREYLQHVQ